MIYVTSFNRGMYSERGKSLLRSLALHMSPGDQCWAFHEDSQENRPAHIHHWEDHGGKVIYRDIFEEMPHLRKVIRRPEFEEAKKDKNSKAAFLNWHAQFFARKVAAIFWSAQEARQPICWVDCDNIVGLRKRNLGRLSPYLENLAREARICYKCREGKNGSWTSSETSFLILRASDGKVRDFCRFWWNLYATGAVFYLKHWADADVFDFVRKLSQYKSIEMINLFGRRPGWKCFHHRLGHAKMAKLRASTKIGSGAKKARGSM